MSTYRPSHFSSNLGGWEWNRSRMDLQFSNPLQFIWCNSPRYLERCLGITSVKLQFKLERDDNSTIYFGTWKILGGKRVKGQRLLYFTDNMVTYDVFRKGTSTSTPLWLLFLKIKLLELELQCTLQVIHIPGTNMIEQGTNGLSQGFYMQSLGSHKSNSLIPLLWHTTTPTFKLLQWLFSIIPTCYPPNTSWIFQMDMGNRTRTPMINKCVLWSPSLTFSRQAFLQAMSIEVETPTIRGHIFLVPRILQCQYGRLSKFRLFHGQHDTLPLPFIPLILYYLPPFNWLEIYHQQREAERNRLDTPPNIVPSWIRNEIECLLRVSTSHWL